MGHRQKGHGKKRRKSWHRGAGEARRFTKAMKLLPKTEEKSDDE